MKFLNVKILFGKKIDYARLEKDCKDTCIQYGFENLKGEAVLALIVLQLIERIEKLENK